MPKICHICKNKKEIRGKTFEKFFKKIYEKMQVEFMTELADILDYIRDNPQVFSKNSLLKKGVFDDFFQKIFTLANERIIANFSPIFEDFFNESQKESLKEVGEKNFDIYISSRETRDFARKKSAEMVSHINETTRQELRDLISQSWQNNDSLATLTDKITQKFSQFNTIRSALIAQQESSMIYENGKNSGFEKAVAKIGVKGWKKAITQEDMSVRSTHRQNALDGWIENDIIFSGTGDLLPPFGFWCRCTVVRKVDEPDNEEKLRVYYGDVNLPNISDAQSGNLEKISKNLQKQLPWLPPPDKITWFNKEDENIMGGFIPSKNSIFLNKKSLEIFGFQEMKETLEHEYGHSVLHFLKQNPNEILYNISAKELLEEIFDRGGKLLGEKNETIQEAFLYPFDIYRTKKYNGKNLTDQEAFDISREEIFAEAMRFYQNGYMIAFPEYYKTLMDFIFQHQEEIATKKRKWSQSKIKRFELSGAEFDFWMKEIQDAIKDFSGVIPGKLERLLEERNNNKN